jgi:hypothetical protein
MTTAEQNVQLSVYAIVPMDAGIFEAVAAIVAAAQLRMIAVKPFAAVVGDGIETAGHSREELMPLLLSRQRLIEQILQVSPVLPVRFGTLAPDEAGVRAILTTGASKIAAAFDQIAGCVQMEIIARWDAETVFSEIAKEDAIVALKQQWTERPDETLRAAIGDRVKYSLERRRAVLAQSLLGTLRTLAGDVIAYPPTDDRVVLQAALLIKTADLIALDDLLEEVEATHGGQISFRLIGPLAPCCFATVEMEMIAPAALDRAMSLLAIARGASAAEVRQAYHRAVKAEHPDATGEAGAAMAALAEAYRIVSLYVGSPAEEGDNPQHTIFVSVKRQEPAYNVAA